MNVEGELPTNRNVADSAPVTPRSRWPTLLILVFLKVSTSYDAGAFSASLGVRGGITQHLTLSQLDKGELSSSVFFGNFVGTALAGFLFSHFSAKRLLFGAMLLHCLMTLLFASSTSLAVALLSRFFIGFSLAFLVLFGPLWCYIFAPEERRTTWLAYNNVGVPIGMVVGFAVEGILGNVAPSMWAWPFFFKAVAMLPLLGVLLYTTSEGLDVRVRVSHAVDGDFSTFEERVTKVLRQALETAFLLSSNLRFLGITMGLATFYFVASFYQNWVTPYLRGSPFDASMSSIVVGVVAVTLTAPLIGFVGAGFIVDSGSGDQSNKPRAYLVVTVASIAFATLSFILLFFSTALEVFLVLWLMICFGSAIVPVAMGLLLHSVAVQQRSTASSFAAMFYNLLGFSCGPLLGGYAMEKTGSMIGGFALCSLVAMAGATLFGVTSICYSTQRHRNWVVIRSEESEDVEV